MSLTHGLVSPRTPLRLFLDRELTAGVRRLRQTYRGQLPAGPLILPGDGVGFEAGTVGTAIDQRLRLSFTCVPSLDAATFLGWDNCRAAAGVRGRDNLAGVLAEVGEQLIQRLTDTVTRMQLDDRNQPMLRAEDEEEDLARMLIAAAWYALNYRNPFAFPDTPLVKAAVTAPATFTFDRLLAVPHRHLVDDLLAQLHAAQNSALERLRLASQPEACASGSTFDGSSDLAADADLIIEGTLVDIKSTRRVHNFPLPTVYQLLGYTLMDYSDRYRIDAVGIYLSRAGTLITWPLEDYLALLGARRRDLGELRDVFARLLKYEGCRADDEPLPEQAEGVNRLLDGLVAPLPDGCCEVCAQPLPEQVGAHRRRRYCSSFCRQRSFVLRRRGWLNP
ncbi:hypothetical protein ACFWYW_30645 [Nonomuraea sp. NPDC059023]|uniref:hypothetical protein n=1 Tax=unclassified Nonomuraea TaxID=2593643 RepID=UPI003697D227